MKETKERAILSTSEGLINHTPKPKKETMKERKERAILYTSEELINHKPKPKKELMKKSKERAILSTSEEVINGSSRGYYRAQGRVPFEWESEPGKPKSPGNVEWIPPPSPSPAMQSAQLTREQKKQKISEEHHLSRHTSSPLIPVDGCFLNPVRVIVHRTVKRWDLVPFFRAD